MRYDRHTASATAAGRSAWLRCGHALALCAVLLQLTAPALAETPLVARGESPNLRLPTELDAKLAQRGDLTLRRTPLQDALFTISELWKLNLVVGEDVQGQVNCDFKDTPVGEILGTILLSNGYTFKPYGRSLVILKAEQLGDPSPLFETATIPVPVGDAQQLLEAVSMLNSPKGKTKAIPAAKSLLVVDYPDRVAEIRQFVASLQVDSPSGEPVAAEENVLQPMYLAPQFVPAVALKDAMVASLSKEGKVVVVEKENRLMVLDYPANLRLAEDIFHRLDTPRAQVRITAYIYDISLEDMEQLGINWRNVLHGRYNAEGVPQSNIDLDSITMVPFDVGATGGALTIMNASRYFDLTAAVQALTNCKNSKLLADPNVVVVDNEDASVSIVSEIPFQQLTQTGQGGNIGTTAFREAGVKLRVRPRIADDDTITMQVEPEFSRLTGFTPETDQPIIDRRTAQTLVRVANGQTVIIGGLRTQADIGNYTGIWLLKDIPHIGWLFRSRETNKRESELIVFVKPEIVTPAEPLREREECALGTTHHRLDGIPKGEICGDQCGPNGERIQHQPAPEEVPAPPPNPNSAKHKKKSQVKPSYAGVTPLPPTRSDAYRAPQTAPTIQPQSVASTQHSASPTQPAMRPQQPQQSPAVAQAEQSYPASGPTRSRIVAVQPVGPQTSPSGLPTRPGIERSAAAHPNQLRGEANPAQVTLRDSSANPTHGTTGLGEVRKLPPVVPTTAAPRSNYQPRANYQAAPTAARTPALHATPTWSEAPQQQPRVAAQPRPAAQRPQQPPTTPPRPAPTTQQKSAATTKPQAAPTTQQPSKSWVDQVFRF